MVIVVVTVVLFVMLVVLLVLLVVLVVLVLLVLVLVLVLLLLTAVGAIGRACEASKESWWPCLLHISGQQFAGWRTTKPTTIGAPQLATASWSLLATTRVPS